MLAMPAMSKPSLPFFEETTFDQAAASPFPEFPAEFIACTFRNLDLASNDFSHSLFEDCTFESCNLSLVRLKQASLRNVHFKNCKMLGVLFLNAAPTALAVSFENCLLDNCAFAGLKLKKTRFSGCRLRHADFGNADLSACIFDNADLAGARFENTNLTGADFSTASFYQLDPSQNRVNGLKVCWPEASGLLAPFGVLFPD
jgi:uncharacterized protein YjbI with pentapeptide repeats